MADMTLEGDSSNILSGMGQAHMCRNREEAVQWIEERRVDEYVFRFLGSLLSGNLLMIAIACRVLSAPTKDGCKSFGLRNEYKTFYMPVSRRDPYTCSH